MIASNEKYILVEDDGFQIEVTVSNPTQIKSTISSYTVYKVKGVDNKAEFQCTRRYSEFDMIRQCMLSRWPGCYVPPLPSKKAVGNSESGFVEHRRKALENFCLQISQSKHLWYSIEFQMFLKKAGDFQSVNIEKAQNLKALPLQNQQEIIKKYDQTFPKLNGRGLDTLTLSKVLQFHKYLKKMLPILQNFREIMLNFIQAKSNNYQQYSVLYSYILPEYEKICLKNHLNQQTEGRLIFLDENDEKMAALISKIKQVISRRNFDQLLNQICQDEKQVTAFLQVYKQHTIYQRRVNQLKQKEKDLELEQQQLNIGKQTLFKSIFKSNIEENKKNIEREITINKDFIATNSLLSDLITMILGFYEIDRFREGKMNKYNRTLKEIAGIQIQFSRIQKQLSNHILDNHNLI